MANSDATKAGSPRDRISLRPARRLLDLLQHGADRLTLAEAFPRVLLAPRDDGLGLGGAIQHHDDLPALHLLDLAGDELAELVANSSRIFSRSPSRTLWMIRCLADITALRPKS